MTREGVMEAATVMLGENNANRMVLLRHDLPDGSSHFDWLIQRSRGGPDAPGATPDLDARCLLSIRVSGEFPFRPGQTAAAEQIADHRGLYLDYEGPVSGDRGRVERVARGIGAIMAENADLVVIDGRFAAVEGGVGLADSLARWELDKADGTLRATGRAGPCRE